jgi:hypothetical protein
MVVHPSGIRALTLVEVAVGAFVMAFGIAMSLVAVQSGFRSMDEARNLTAASQILESELARLRALPWRSISTEIACIDQLPEREIVDIATLLPSQPELGSRFSLVRTVTPSEGRDGSMYDLTLTIAWTSPYGVRHERTITTRYGKDGLHDYRYTLAG